MLAWLGCSVHIPAVTSIEVPVRYRVQITGQFGDVQAVGSDDILQPATSVAMTLLVELEPTRKFRDGSYARLVRFKRAEMVQGTGEAQAALSIDLAGRTVELRTFPDGEILDISWGEKVAGQGRYLDVFEVVFPALSPAAPAIAEGESVKSRIIWPFRKAKALRWDNIVDTVWENHGRVEVGETDAWKLSYSGPWGTEGQTRRTVPPQKLEAKGMADGTVHFDRRTSDLVDHRFVWSRTVTVQGRTGILSQEQHFEGHVEVVP